MAEPPEQMQEPTGPMAASAVPIGVCENRTEEAAEQDLACAETMNDSAEKKENNVEQMSASAENKEEPAEKEETTEEEMSASAENKGEPAEQTKESAEQKAESEEHPGIAQCKERIEQWYPNLSTETHFVPAVYMNRTLHKPEKVAGRDVYVLQPLPQESDARDDAANNKVLRCIRQSSRGEVMFVISQLQFRNYLNKLTHPKGTSVPAPAKAADLKKENVGDFDALIIHRHYGVLACEIKAVGDNFAALNMSQEEQTKTIEKILQFSVIHQLGKSHDMLKHLVPQGKAQPRVKTTLMVPNISRDQLRAALSKGLRTQKEKLCAYLGIDKTADPVPKCLTSDDVENPATWWQQCMELDGPDSAMTLDVYLDLVARNSKNLFHQFVAKLRGFAGEGLHIWAAGMYHEFLPEGFNEASMDISLRTPPSITRHVMKHRAMGGKKNIRGYQQSSIPLPSDGPEPIEVDHQGPRHHEKEPYDCKECGRLVAAKLKSLGVGTTTAREPTGVPQPPRYRDVLILTWDGHFHEANKATRVRPARPPSGLIVGLREAGFPVTVLETGDDVAVGTVATMTGPDHIIAAGSRFVQGLERKIVVYVETDKPVYFDLDWGRLCTMSRCTSQLIHVKPPPTPPTRYQY